MSDNISQREELIDQVVSNTPRPYKDVPGSAQHNYDTGNQPDGQTWTTAELQRDFEVLAFGAPLVQVRRKSDGVVGTLEFTHSPRVYFDFLPLGNGGR